MTLTKYGTKEWRLALTVFPPLILLCAAGGIWVTSAGYAFAALLFFAMSAILFFFRDPERKIPENKNLILAPADGEIRNIELISASETGHLAGIFDGKDMLRISIFVSVADVRINRAPCEFTIKLRERKEMADSSGEAVVLAGISENNGREIPLAVKQYSSAGIEKIVCEPVPGDKLFCGQQYGMLKIGSKVELYLPAKSDLMEIKVAVGDRVQAGLTAVVEIAEK